MSTQFRVSSMLRQKLHDLSVSPEVVLRHAGLPPGLFDEGKTFVSTEQLFALYRSIDEVSGDPMVGLKLGTEDRVERYDPISIAALYTRSFREALDRAARFKQLTCPEEIRVASKGRESSVTFVWKLAKGTEPATLTDLCFAWILSIARRGTGRPIVPHRVDFERGSEQQAAYEAHFGCPVRFEAGRNALVFDTEDLDRPFMTRNTELLGMISPQLEQELSYQRTEQGFRDRVKTALKRLLAGRRPSLGDVAKELGQSTRTLQRRLAEVDATFQGVLEDARRELAHHYLLKSELELNETAYLLGFEDSSSFFRAFRGWEGLPPGEWRQKHRPAEDAAAALAVP